MLNVFRAQRRAAECTIITWFGAELSQQVKRPVAEVLRHGLQNGDFPYDGVQMKHRDGTVMSFRNAFAVKKDEHVAIFTEHLGYHVFHAEDCEIL